MSDETTKAPRLWALAKGHVRPNEITFAPWLFNAAGFSHKWHDETVVSEAEYDAAIDHVLSITLG